MHWSTCVCGNMWNIHYLLSSERESVDLNHCQLADTLSTCQHISNSWRVSVTHWYRVIMAVSYTTYSTLCRCQSDHLCLSFCLWSSLTFGSNSWLRRAISLSLTPLPRSPSSLTSGNFYSCHLRSQMTQLSFQLPPQHPAPNHSLASRLSPFLSVSDHNRNRMGPQTRC